MLTRLIQSVATALFERFVGSALDFAVVNRIYFEEFQRFLILIVTTSSCRGPIFYLWCCPNDVHGQRNGQQTVTADVGCWLQTDGNIRRIVQEYLRKTRFKNFILHSELVEIFESSVSHTSTASSTFLWWIELAITV